MSNPAKRKSSKFFTDNENGEMIVPIYDVPDRVEEKEDKTRNGGHTLHMDEEDDNSKKGLKNDKLEIEPIKKVFVSNEPDKVKWEYVVSIILLIIIRIIYLTLVYYILGS